MNDKTLTNKNLFFKKDLLDLLEKTENLVTVAQQANGKNSVQLLFNIVNFEII